MATNGTKDLSQQEQASLQDSEITTAKVNRRSFLARAMGASTLAVGTALTVACGNEPDACDTRYRGRGRERGHWRGCRLRGLLR